MLSYLNYNTFLLRSSEFIDTTIVETDINTAASAGCNKIPLEIKTPAASGSATMLYPVAQKRF